MTTETDQQAALRRQKELEAEQEARTGTTADAIGTLVLFALIALAIFKVLEGLP